MEAVFVVVLLGFAALWLVFQPWFWFSASFLAGLAALFAMLASIIHFEIFGAVGFFLLMALFWGVPLAIAAHREEAKRWNDRHRVRVYQRDRRYEL
jgi:hypothetical protein